MTNAEKFQSVFGIYATELWAKPEKDFLIWLNSEATNELTGEWIYDPVPGFGEVYCSNCKNHVYDPDDYCPCCGSHNDDMRSKSE